MTKIKRNYWDKHIPIKDKSCSYTESTRIGNKVYYGKSLKKRLGEKAALITFKVIPVIAISILFPISIPVLAKTNVYRNTGRRIREVKYNQKFKFVDAYVKPKPPGVSKSLSTTIMPSTDLPREVLKLVFRNEVKGLYGKEAVKYLQRLRPVCKEWMSIANEIEIELINSGNIILNDLFSRKDEALAYVEAHKHKIRTLKFLPSLEWEDTDIKTLLLACPYLERLNTAIPLSEAAFNDILGLKDLKHLRMSSPNNRNLDFTLLSQLKKIKNLDLCSTQINDDELKTFLTSHPHLEELRLSGERDITDAVLADIVQCQELKRLEIVECDNIVNYSAISNLPKLKYLCIRSYSKDNVLPTLANLPSLLYLRLTFFDPQGEAPSFDSLTKLKTFRMCLNGQRKLSLPSLDALTALQELHITGDVIDKVPSLDALVKLKILHIGFTPILSIPRLNALTNLEEFIAINLPIKDIPLLPHTLKKLYIDNCKIYSPSLDHLTNLEELIIKNFHNSLPPNYFDKLSQLKKLEFSSKNPGVFPSLDTLTNLQVLRLKARFWTPLSFTHLKNLKGLEVWGEVPPLNASVKLEVLVVDNLLELTNLPWLELKDLKALALHFNPYKDLPNELFKHLSNLEIFSIDRSLDQLPNLKKQQKLKEIYFPANCRKNLKQLDKHIHLKRFPGKALNFDPLFEALIE